MCSESEKSTSEKSRSRSSSRASLHPSRLVRSACRSFGCALSIAMRPASRSMSSMGSRRLRMSPSSFLSSVKREMCSCPAEIFFRSVSGYKSRERSIRFPIAVFVQLTHSSRVYCALPSRRFAVTSRLRIEESSMTTYSLSRYTRMPSTCGTAVFVVFSR